MFSVSHPQSGCFRYPGSEEFREGQEVTEGTVLTIYYSITNHPQTVLKQHRYFFCSRVFNMAGLSRLALSLLPPLSLGWLTGRTGITRLVWV